mgnify:CR=1 FL=1
MLERLISIIYILMNKGTVTAGELAERFEVSTRTIYRDIEALSIAGIPVYCRKGKNGGICLTEEFVLNKMLITKEEQQEILAALVGLQETEVSDGNREQETLKKLGEFFQTEPVPWVQIDLSDWSGLRKQMYEDIKRAILTRHVIEFDYYGQNRPMSHRVVEPVQLQFKEYTWYLRAYCRERQDFRTFKLFRMQRLCVQAETFVPKREPALLHSAKTDGSTSVEPQAQEQEFPVTPLTIWIDKKEDTDYMKGIIENAAEIKVVGIIKPNKESVTASNSSAGMIGYTHELTKYLINKVNDTEIAKQQISIPEINVFTGTEFSKNEKFDMTNLTREQRAYFSSLSSEELAEYIASYTKNANTTYEENLKKLENSV